MKKMVILRFVTLAATISTLIHTSNSAKILMTGVQLRSHMSDQLAVAEELLSHGHQVYYAVAARYIYIYRTIVYYAVAARYI